MTRSNIAHRSSFNQVRFHSDVMYTFISFLRGLALSSTIFSLQTCLNIQIHASRHLADPIVSVERSIVKRFARVCLNTWVSHRTVDQSVFRMRNALFSWRVRTIDAWTRVQERAARTLTVESYSIIRSARVEADLQESHLYAVRVFLVSNKSLFLALN